MKKPIVSGRQTIKALTKAGFTIVRQKGSHVRLEKRGEEKTIKVTVPLHKELKKGTLNIILFHAEISLEEFKKLLS